MWINVGYMGYRWTIYGLYMDEVMVVQGKYCSCVFLLLAVLAVFLSKS